MNFFLKVICKKSFLQAQFLLKTNNNLHGIYNISVTLN